MPMNQSTDSTSTSPIAGMLGTAFKVAARITIAEPGNAVGALGGDQRHAEHQHQIAGTTAAWLVRLRE